MSFAKKALLRAGCSVIVLSIVLLASSPGMAVKRQSVFEDQGMDPETAQAAAKVTTSQEVQEVKEFSAAANAVGLQGEQKTEFIENVAGKGFSKGQLDVAAALAKEGIKGAALSQTYVDFALAGAPGAGHAADVAKLAKAGVDPTAETLAAVTHISTLGLAADPTKDQIKAADAFIRGGILAAGQNATPDEDAINSVVALRAIGVVDGNIDAAAVTEMTAAGAAGITLANQQDLTDYQAAGAAGFGHASQDEFDTYKEADAIKAGGNVTQAEFEAYRALNNNGIALTTQAELAAAVNLRTTAAIKDHLKLNQINLYVVATAGTGTARTAVAAGFAGALIDKDDIKTALTALNTVGINDASDNEINLWVDPQHTAANVALAALNLTANNSFSTIAQPAYHNAANANPANVTQKELDDCRNALENDIKAGARF